MTYLFIWRMGKRSHGDFDITPIFQMFVALTGFAILAGYWIGQIL